MKRYLLVILCVFLCIGGCGKSSSKKQETESVNKHSKHKKDTSENSDKEDEVLEKNFLNILHLMMAIFLEILYVMPEC